AAGELRPPGEGARAWPALVAVRPGDRHGRVLRRPRRRIIAAGPTVAADPRSGLKNRKERGPGRAAARSSRRRVLWFGGDGQGHREADPPAVADLLPDGRAAARDRTRDPS